MTTRSAPSESAPAQTRCVEAGTGRAPAFQRESASSEVNAGSAIRPSDPLIVISMTSAAFSDGEPRPARGSTPTRATPGSAGGPAAIDRSSTPPVAGPRSPRRGAGSPPVLAAAGSSPRTVATTAAISRRLVKASTSSDLPRRPARYAAKASVTSRCAEPSSPENPEAGTVFPYTVRPYATGRAPIMTGDDDQDAGTGRSVPLAPGRAMVDQCEVDPPEG
jgi:hypothetical protein